MPLELTPEILSKIESMADATDRQVTVCQWPIIRDLVLEAAAKALMERAARIASVGLAGEWQAQVCRDNATLIRAMKGTGT